MACGTTVKLNLQVSVGPIITRWIVVAAAVSLALLLHQICQHAQMSCTIQRQCAHCATHRCSALCTLPVHALACLCRSRTCTHRQSWLRRHSSTAMPTSTGERCCFAIHVPSACNSLQRSCAKRSKLCSCRHLQHTDTAVTASRSEDTTKQV